MRPSVTLIGSIIFFGFVLSSIHSLYKIFQSPVCDKQNDICYKSYLNFEPKLDLYVFVSDSSKHGHFDVVYKKHRFDYRSTFEENVQLEISKTVRNNGSMFIHTVILPSKARNELYLGDLINEVDSTYIKSRLTKYMIPRSSTFNLLNSDNNNNKIEKPVTHLKSRYAIMMCIEDVSIPHTAIPFEIVNLLRINKYKHFLPILRPDVLNMRLRDLKQINNENTIENITYIYTPISFGKMRFFLQIEATLKNFIELGFTEKDLDELKGIFADTNLYLLCATLCIGSIHLLLDFLSFKNDVSFWKSQKSMAGLSTRTVMWRTFSQTVIFLYLLDEGTSLLVLVPSGIATIIEFWKVSKVFKTTISWKGLKFNKNIKETDEEKKTREYDEECMNYLLYLLYPLCIGAAIYSLLYQPHKSWYSWTINSLVNGVYAFGFLFMLPQLFINYRLKSVAALPWRAFTYRAFNTFIDDIFAFIITMPTAHRVACFRDDVVFIVYLYQRWLYPVDKSRIESVEGEEIEVKDKKVKAQ